MREGELGAARLPQGFAGLAASVVTPGEEYTNDGLPLPRRLWAIFSLSAGTLLLMLDASIANVGLPTMAHELHVTATDSVLIVAVYNLVLAMTLMPLAALGAHIGLRRLFLAGLGIYLAGAALSWFVDSLPWLLAVRAVQSLGAAAALSVGSALVRATYPRGQLGRGLGFNTLAAATGGAMAPVIGGAIVSHASWHFVFIAGMPLALAAMLTGRALPEPEKAGRRFDQLGSLLCAATFGLLIFGLHFITAAPSPLLPAALLFAGLAAGFALIWYELRHPHPVLPVDLLRQKAMALSTGAGLCGYLASTSLILALPFRLHADGYSAGQIGVVILPYAASATIFAPAAGMLSDRISPTKLGVVGTAIAFVALVFLTRLPAAPTHLQVQWPMALCGVGFGLFMAPNARLIIGAVSADRAASASSLISTTRMMSQAIASTFVGALLAFGVWPASAIIAACLTALAFCLSLARLWSRES